MKYKLIMFICICLVLCCLTSCHSAIAYGFGGDTPYAGTQLLFMSSDSNKDDSKNNQEWTIWDNTFVVLFKTVDFPLCLVADTILYPVMLLDRSIIEPQVTELEPDLKNIKPVTNRIR